MDTSPLRSSMDFSPLWTILGAVVGALIAGGVALLVQRRQERIERQRRAEDREERRRMRWLDERRQAYLGYLNMRMKFLEFERYERRGRGAELQGERKAFIDRYQSVFNQVQVVGTEEAMRAVRAHDEASAESRTIARRLGTLDRDSKEYAVVWEEYREANRKEGQAYFHAVDVFRADLEADAR